MASKRKRTLFTYPKRSSYRIVIILIQNTTLSRIASRGGGGCCWWRQTRMWGGGCQEIRRQNGKKWNRFCSRSNKFTKLLFLCQSIMFTLSRCFCSQPLPPSLFCPFASQMMNNYSCMSAGSPRKLISCKHNTTTNSPKWALNRFLFRGSFWMGLCYGIFHAWTIFMASPLQGQRKGGGWNCIALN